MGQARNRGTKEERVANAVERDKNIAEQIRLRYAAFEATLTDEQRQQLAEQKRKGVNLVAVCATLGLFSGLNLSRRLFR